MEINIVIPTHQRTSLLDKCLRSLEDAKIDTINLNTYIIINGEDKKTQEFLKHTTFLDLNINYETITKAHNGAARNRVFNQLKGEWTFFIDDDAWVPRDYFRNFIHIIKNNTQLDILGGSDCASLTGETHQRLLNAIYNSPVAMGPTSRRHSSIYKDKIIKAGEKDLTLCNLWVRTSFLIENNLKFPTFLSKNEENYFLNIAKNLNGEIYYSYNLKVNHLRRKNIPAMLTTIFHSGQCRLEMTMAQSSYENMLYFIPIFCLSLVVLLPLTFVVKQLFLIYLFLISIVSIKVSVPFRVIRKIPALILLHPAIHVAYTAGMVFFLYNKVHFKLIRGA